MRLYFLRHGLADRSAWDGDDFERPLTKNGREKMRQEAKFLESVGFKTDRILSSPLVRAAQTAEIIGEVLAIEFVEIDERLDPGFDRRHVKGILRTNKDADSLLLVGHEPSFSTVISRLIGGGNIVCKKGALARVDVIDVDVPTGELVWLLPPKVLAHSKHS